MLDYSCPPNSESGAGAFNDPNPGVVLAAGMTATVEIEDRIRAPAK
jgi:hypothetical protein